MAKRGFIKSIQKNSPFKKLSTTFISLALLFILSIVLYFVFNKYTIENFAVNGNKLDPSSNKLEIALISSQAKMHTDHSFVRSNGDWDRIKQTYGTNPAIIIETQDKSKIGKYITKPNFSNGDYPMVVLTNVKITSGMLKRTYISHITRPQLSYNAVVNAINNNM
jgi:hypothetical protein